jgi:Zn-dependent protease/predicted transcriptional regulator
MPWSIQVGRIFGIPIRLHLTFLLLIGWLFSLGIGRGDLTEPLIAVGLFACVLLHELGHSVVALRYGVEVESITLLPIGGLARMARIPKDPRQEFNIAIAGPIVNFVLWPLLLLAHRAVEPAVTGDAWSQHGFLLWKLADVNLKLGLFNLLPAFPMDGGRILRAALASRMPHAKATGIATSLGQMLAFGLGFMGLFNGHPLWVFIALFLFIGAAEEGARAQTEAFVEGVTVREAMMTQFVSLRRGDGLNRAVELLLAGTQQEFPVVEEGEVVGMLTRQRLLHALAETGPDRYVSEVMEPASEAVSPDSPLQDVLERMMTKGVTVVPVQSDLGLCGLLTAENTSEFVLVRAALFQNRSRHAA